MRLHRTRLKIVPVRNTRQEKKKEMKSRIITSSNQIKLVQNTMAFMMCERAQEKSC